MRSSFSFILLLMISAGCQSERIAYRYGDGMPYQAITGESVKNKACLRSVKFIDEKETRLHIYDSLRADEPSVSDVVSHAPDVLTDCTELNGMSIDVSVRFHNATVDMDLLDSLASFLPVVPAITHYKREAVVEIRETGRSELLSSSVLIGRHSSKISVILFLGDIPFDRLEGYQENILNYEPEFEKDGDGKIKINEDGSMKMIIPAKVANAFNRALGRCIAMQIRKCALERLIMPDVDFE